MQIVSQKQVHSSKCFLTYTSCFSFSKSDSQILSVKRSFNGHKFLKKNYFTTFNIFTLLYYTGSISNDQPKLYCQLFSYKWETELMIFFYMKTKLVPCLCYRWLHHYTFRSLSWTDLSCCIIYNFLCLHIGFVAHK